MKIFSNPRDKEVFLKIIRQVQQIYNFQIYAYSIMDNHYHLLIKDVAKNLSNIIGLMQTKYAIYYNKSYDHSGAVFMKPFKSKPIYTKGQFFSLLSYVLNNPVKAGIACFYNEYKWNSPLFGYEKYNITDYLYVNKFYKPIAGLSLNDYIIKRSNSYKIAEIEKESFSIEEAEKEFFKITDTFSKHKHFSINQIPLSVKKKIISKALYIGISSRQIAKITGLSKSSICQMKMKKSYL